MAIDAMITGARRNPDGTVRIELGPRETPHGSSCPGQKAITIENPPPGRVDGLVGTEVWGGSESLMVGDTKWADRVGYTRCRLVRRDG